MLSQVTWALAGTTGGISGTLRDSTTGKPVPDAKVTASSPSETTSTTTDAGGHFTFLNLAPDTYTLSAEKDQFQPATVGGVTVFADQNVTVSLATQPQLKTIARITSRAAGNLVKPGTTADVYSVNAATQQVVSGSGGGFNLNSAYSGIYSQPGVTSYIGNAGWGQVFYIRGSSYNQIGYEFDGVPVNRAFDNYQANSLSSLGQQELQVYTGGSPSGASSATLGGFINQVIKTGTYPGFGTLTGGYGFPGFYRNLQAEAGGATPNRTFSYYVGLMGFNQDFPTIDWENAAGINPNGNNQYGLFGPVAVAPMFGSLFGAYGTGTNYVGQFVNGPWPACQGPNGANPGFPQGFDPANPGPFNGACYGFGPFTSSYLKTMYERDNVVNLHFAIPHKFDSGRDDVQLLYDNSMQYQVAGNSINDNGGLRTLNGFVAPYANADCGFTDAAGNPIGCGFLDMHGNPYTGQFNGLCGYENLFGVGCSNGASPLAYVDSLIFSPGTSFGQLADTAKIVPYAFPNSPANRPLNNFGGGTGQTSGIDPNLRDAFWNDVGIVKLQYTKNIGTNAYARLFGYTFYSDWQITGPVLGSTGYIDGLLPGGFFANGGGGLFSLSGAGDYELDTHTRGLEFQYANQLNPQNLLRFTANYTTATVSRWNNSTFISNYSGNQNRVTNFTNGDPNNPLCFDPTTGDQGSCFAGATSGTLNDPLQGLASADPCGTGALAPTTAACASGAKFIVTRPSGYGTFNTVRPQFVSVALEDEFKPNDKLNLNIGVRYEMYEYDLANSNTPENNFWFNAQAQVVCYDPGTGQPLFTPLAPGEQIPPGLVLTDPLAPCGTAPSGQEALHPTGPIPGCTTCGTARYTAIGPEVITHAKFSPRIGGTWTMNPDTVFRFSAGVYTQPTETAFEQYLNQSGKGAALFDFNRFWGLGFTTPAHDNPVQFSNNYDFSIEHRFRNTDVTMKVSPFYRDTHNQIVTVILGPNFASGVNIGHQRSYGVEFGIQKGDPTRDGLSGGLSYTYTKAEIQYGDLPNGTNALDYLNNYVKAFNALTSAGGGAQCYQNGAPDPACTDIDGTGIGTVIANPYFNMSQQELLDRNAYTSPYINEPPNDPTDQGSFPGTAIWPHQFAGWLQYKRGRWSIAPNFILQSGASYGSPTDTYGIDPRACGQNQAAAGVVSAGSGQALACDFLTASASPFVTSGYLAIPNPYTNRMDRLGQFEQPWQLNIGALIHYDISPKLAANLTLANIYNRCFGGSKVAWSNAFGPDTHICGYDQNNFEFVGGAPGSGFYYGASPTDPANGPGRFAPAFRYPFAPVSGYLPFQAYLQLQIKI
jgi:outer membrane receptor protein involved in Fe transport